MVFERLQKVLGEVLVIDGDDINLEDSLVDDLGANSLDMVEIMIAIEEEFEIEVEDDEFVMLVTVDEIVRYIKGKV